jgi:hypothetical protein
MRPLTEDQKALAGTPDHIAYARKIAIGYIRRFPWHAEDIESAALWGLCVAAATYDPTGGYPYKIHVRRRVKDEIIEVFRLSYPRNYRWCYRFRRVGVAPSIVWLRGPVESGDEPVGWEIEYQDELEGLSRRASDPVSAMALRILYGHAAANTLGKVAAAMGCTLCMAKRKVGRAVGTIAERFERERYEDAVLAGRSKR